MRIPKVYLETTMFNYFFDEDRDAHADTVKLFSEIKAGKYVGYTSVYVADELANAAEPKRGKMLSLIEEFGIIVISADKEAEKLADIYINEGVIPSRFRMDGVHIAIATVNDLEYIFSLNFQHINKLKTKIMTENINIRHGYRGVYICSPMEVIEHDD